jgi:sRNA-binding protein
MSAGISLVGWLAIGAVAAGTVVNADSQRKSIHAQQDALRASQEADARDTAEAATSAQVAANAKLADSKRRRLASTLSTGADQTLAGAGTALGAGASGATSKSTVAASAPRSTSVLSGGAV